MTGYTLDAGALIALDRDDRRVVSLLGRAAELDLPITVPATVLAQAIRNPARQVRLAILLAAPTTHVIPLDEDEAGEIGILLAQSSTADIVDVVVCARRANQIVVTSDSRDLRRLDPDLGLFSI